MNPEIIESDCTKCKHYIHDDLDGLCDITMGGTKIMLTTKECNYEPLIPVATKMSDEEYEVIYGKPGVDIVSKKVNGGM